MLREPGFLGADIEPDGPALAVLDAAEGFDLASVCDVGPGLSCTRRLVFDVPPGGWHGAGAGPG